MASSNKTSIKRISFDGINENVYVAHNLLAVHTSGSDLCMCVRVHALICKYLVFAYTNKDEYLMFMFCFNGGVGKCFDKYLSNNYGPIFAQTITNLGGWY